MEKKVKSLLDRKLAKVSDRINKEWFYEFFDLFFKYNYQGEILPVVEAFFNTEEINRIEIDPPMILLNAPASKKAMGQFMEFLKNKLDSLSHYELQECFEDMMEYFEENVDTDISATSRLVKFTTLEFNKDINFDIQNQEKFLRDPENNNLYIGAKLGAFNLASMKARKIKEKKEVQFDHLKMLDGLKRQHLGYMVMQRFFMFMREYMKGYHARGYGISKCNLEAQQFYNRLGGVFYSAKDMQIIPFNKLQDYSYVSYGVYYDKTKILELCRIMNELEPISFRHHMIKHYDEREMQHHKRR